MKKFLSIATATILTCSLLAGCGSSGSSGSQASSGGGSSSPSSQAEGTGGSIADEIVIAKQSDGYTFDPTIVDDNGAVWLYDLFLEGLVKPSDDGKEIIPCLADDWKLSDDGLTYTFNLKPGIKFADGTDVTADDWIFTFERAKAATEGNWTFAAKDIESVTSPSENVLEVKLSQPNAAMLSNFSNFNMCVQSKAFFEANSYDNSVPMGTGPYFASSWEKEQEIIFDKNPYYHIEGEPKTSRLTVKIVPDDESRVMQLQAGEVDLICDVPFSSMQVLDVADGIKTSAVPSMSNRYLVLNVRDQILGNDKVREALVYGTNKQEIVDMVLYGYGKPAVSYMPEGGLFYNDTIKAKEYDVEKAKALLAEAGYPDGFDIEFYVRSGNAVFEQIATIIKDQWAKLGVNVTLTTLETATLLDLQYAGDFQVLVGSWTDDIPDPVSLSEYIFVHDVSEGFTTGYNNPEAEELFNKSQQQLDESEREKSYFELQQILYDDAPLINLYHQDICCAMKDSVDGFVQIPLGKYRFNNLVKTAE
ncbi:ABC transporter substrate-binding protein [Lachnospiraceae bacterium NSJ-143]|nr:ABC transporter substrate-binding protein [Lachnospiraceae bacterium NSJ-143]